jgi:hypothetical protein
LTIDSGRWKSSGSIVKKAIANSSRAKMLKNQQEYCALLQEELHQGMKDRTRNLDDLKVAVRHLDVFIRGEIPA